MTLNGSGIRDIASVLQISPTTVLSVLRQAAAHTPEPRVPLRILDLEIDEQWSFVQNKGQQMWLWYGLNRHTGYSPVLVLGRRTDANCREPNQKPAPCQVRRFYTEDWQNYPKMLPAKRHQIGRNGTQNIERKTLNFRTHLKRLQRKTPLLCQIYRNTQERTQTLHPSTQLKPTTLVKHNPLWNNGSWYASAVCTLTGLSKPAVSS